MTWKRKDLYPDSQSIAYHFVLMMHLGENPGIRLQSLAQLIPFCQRKGICSKKLTRIFLQPTGERFA